MAEPIEAPERLGLAYGTAPDGSRTVTIPDELRDSVVSFVRDGGAKTPAEIEAIIQTGHDGLMTALAPLSETQAAYKPSADDWSVLELMAHVVTTQQIVVALCTNLGDGHLPPGFGPRFEEQNAQDGVTVARFATLAEARAASAEAHAQQLAFVGGIDQSTNNDVRFKHFLFGAFNAREWAVFQRIHDIDHTPQIAKIVAAPGSPAT